MHPAEPFPCPSNIPLLFRNIQYQTAGPLASRHFVGGRSPTCPAGPANCPTRGRSATCPTASVAARWPAVLPAAKRNSARDEASPCRIAGEPQAVVARGQRRPPSGVTWPSTPPLGSKCRQRPVQSISRYSSGLSETGKVNFCPPELQRRRDQRQRTFFEGLDPSDPAGGLRAGRQAVVVQVDMFHAVVDVQQVYIRSVKG